MTRTIVRIALISMLPAATAAGQDIAIARGQATAVAVQAGAVSRIALETRVTKNSPYTADSVTEFVQVLSDGNRIVRRTSTRLFRDSEGRTRREELGGGGAHAMHTIVITDPLAGTSFVLDPASRTAFKSPALLARVQPAGPAQAFEVASLARAGREADTAAQFAAVQGTGPVTAVAVAGALVASAGGAGNSSKEDLGQQMIEGVPANGTRTTTTIPAGAIGNELPITVVSEQWFSPDLQMLVMTRHSDPRVGDTIYRLTNVTRAEPDRSLFQVPADYTIQDRGPVTIRRQQ